MCAQVLRPQDTPAEALGNATYFRSSVRHDKSYTIVDKTVGTSYGFNYDSVSRRGAACSATWKSVGSDCHHGLGSSLALLLDGHVTARFAIDRCSSCMQASDGASDESVELLGSVLTCEQCYAHFSVSFTMKIKIDVSSMFSYPELSLFLLKVYGSAEVRP